MSLDVDEDILQDFLIEAGEILEQLSEQLVELEKQPDDKDLLNAIFRGFHTVKGGSGFLGLTPLVDVCHCAENLFDLLRNGECEATPELMDTILRSLDTVNDMFATVQSMEMPEICRSDLLEELHRLSSGGAGAPKAEKKKNQSQKLKKPLVVIAALMKLPKMNLKPCSMNYMDLVVRKKRLQNQLKPAAASG